MKKLKKSRFLLDRSQKPISVVGYTIAGVNYYVATDRHDFSAGQVAIYCHERFNETVSIKRIRQLCIAIQNELRNSIAISNFDRGFVKEHKKRGQLYAKTNRTSLSMNITAMRRIWIGPDLLHSPQKKSVTQCHLTQS